MITVIKKIMIKEKEGKRQGKITHVDETRTWDLCSDSTDVPLGHEGCPACILQKTLIQIKLTSSSP